jgi:CheY-like chemotaxis protein
MPEKDPQINRTVSEEDHHIYISFCAREARQEALALQAALKNHGVSAFVRSKAVDYKNEIYDEEKMAYIATKLAKCELAVIMGTPSYGCHSVQPFSTFDELQFVKCNKPALGSLAVKMCDRFVEPTPQTGKLKSRVLSSANMLLLASGNSENDFRNATQWFAGDPMPKDLVEKIICRLLHTRIMRGRSSRPLLPPTVGNLFCSKLQPDAQTIMTVDDDPVHQMVTKQLLEARGFNVLVATSGDQALELIRESGLPSLVLLDNFMPGGMQGAEVCQKLRETYPKYILPIIMVSASDALSSIAVSLANGANDYIPKPARVDILIQRVKTQLFLQKAWRDEVSKMEWT